jgi:hypothetical protein
MDESQNLIALAQLKSISVMKYTKNKLWEAHLIEKEHEGKDNDSYS